MNDLSTWPQSKDMFTHAGHLLDVLEDAAPIHFRRQEPGNEVDCTAFNIPQVDFDELNSKLACMLLANVAEHVDPRVAVYSDTNNHCLQLQFQGNREQAPVYTMRSALQHSQRLIESAFANTADGSYTFTPAEGLRQLELYRLIKMLSNKSQEVKYFYQVDANAESGSQKMLKEDDFLDWTYRQTRSKGEPFDPITVEKYAAKHFSYASFPPHIAGMIFPCFGLSPGLEAGASRWIGPGGEAKWRQ